MKSFKILLSTLALGALGALAIGCGSNPCEEAQEKLTECENTNINFKDDECSEAGECAAECINNASCEELNSQELNNPVAGCMLQCAGGV